MRLPRRLPARPARRERTRRQKAILALGAVVVALLLVLGGLVTGGLVGGDDPDTVAQREPVYTKVRAYYTPVAAAVRANDPVPAPDGAESDPGAPRRVIIPELDVDAGVIAVGSSDGTLVPPSDPDLLGWWAPGATPGDDVGSALITGHSVHDGGGALEKIASLGDGDEVLVETDSGTISYAVSDVVVLSKDELAAQAQELFDQSVDGRVVLITCDDWNGSEWLSNSVVTAVRA